MGNADLRPLLAALHLASPALPVGGFAYSQGLEQAIEEGWVRDADSARVWVRDLMLLGLARQELPLWLACHRAVCAGELAALSALNTRLCALRETAEFRLESAQMGQSAAKLFAQWGIGLDGWPIERWSYACAFAVLCAKSGIEAPVGLGVYLWSWAENQVLAAVKQVPLGQSAGQVVLHALKEDIPQAIEVAMNTPLEMIGSACVGLAITSARHETQYSRLFRS